MNYVSEQSTIDGLLTSGNLRVPVVHENEKYDGDQDTWARVTCQTADGKQMSMGSNPLFRYVGICFVQIFTKPDTGSGAALAVADVITGLLRAKRINGIVFKVPKVVRIGEKDGWYQVNVLTDFYRED